MVVKLGPGSKIVVLNGNFRGLHGVIISTTVDGDVICRVDNHHPIAIHHLIGDIRLKPHDVELETRKDLWATLI